MKSLLTLVLCLCLTACGGGSGVSPEDQQEAALADLRTAVNETIVDAQRKDEVLQIIDELETAAAELHDALVARRSEVLRLNADYDATREELLELANSLDAQVREERTQVFELRRQLTGAMTPDEWSDLQKAETKAMKALAKSLQGI